jgi:hypothetical protein
MDEHPTAPGLPITRTLFNLLVYVSKSAVVAIAESPIQDTSDFLLFNTLDSNFFNI